MSVDAARLVLNDAIRQRTFPCVVVCVGSSQERLWHEALGRLTFDTDARLASVETWFDLASLTKPVATTSVVLDLAARGRLPLEDPVGRRLPQWLARDRAEVNVADLLEHASGLPARFSGGPLPATPAAFLSAIGAVPLEYPPRTRSVYSDLGFILLGWLAADADGRALDVQFHHLLDGVASASAGDVEMGFSVPTQSLDRVAPTEPLAEDVRRRHRLVGEVHDNYAAVLGGVAGHSGLFGTARGVAAFGSVILRAARGHGLGQGPFSAGMIRRALRQSTVPGSSRALGWDRMLTSSSCGTRMSPEAFGHTGFTGTSLWIDPVRDRYYVLLSNRVCNGGNLEAMRHVRRAFHDALADL